MVESPSSAGLLSRLPPMALMTNCKLGESLAMSHLSALPDLPQSTPDDDYGLQQLQYSMHLDTLMLNYTPETGNLRNADAQQAANRFDDSMGIQKRKIYVNKEVLGRLVSVAEELNRAQAQMEVRKLLRQEQKRRLLEQQQDELQPMDPGLITELMARLEVEGTGEDDGATPDGAGYRRTNARAAKRSHTIVRATQVRYPAVLTSVAPKDRWGYFRALQRLMPAANGVRPGHIAFGSSMSPSLGLPTGPRGARQPTTGAAAVKAAKQIQMEVDRQGGGEAGLMAEAAAAMAAAVGGTNSHGAVDGTSTVDDGAGECSAGGADPLSHLDAAVAAVMHAHQVREARRAAARQLAEDEGLPSETWWDIVQRRKKLMYFRKLLGEMSDRMDLIKLHRAAKVIQKAWRAHRHTRARNASEEIALLQRELVHRKAMELALRQAAEAAILEQQERSRRRAARMASRLAALSALHAAAEAAQQAGMRHSQSGASTECHSARGVGNSRTFSRATSGKNLGWEDSLRSSLPSSLSQSVSRAGSRVASARARAEDAGEGGGVAQPAYVSEQQNLWCKIQELIGSDWDLDDGGVEQEEDEEEEDEEHEEDGEEGVWDGEDEEAARLRRRQQRNAARKAERRAVAEDGSEGAQQQRRRKKKKARQGLEDGEGSGLHSSKATLLAKVVKQAMLAAKAIQAEDVNKGAGRRGGHSARHKGKHRLGAHDPAVSMRMLSAAAAALNMTVEAYVAMRNRKIGVTALQPWQPPPFPLVVEADGKELVIQEHELMAMEEEARRELLEKAALDFVLATTTAVGPPLRGASSSMPPHRESSTTSTAAPSSTAADTASVTTWCSSTMTASVSAISDAENSRQLLQTLSRAKSPSEVVAAFAAVAAPSLTISEDDVWALVKEKLRHRTAARAGGSCGGGLSTAGATVASVRHSFFDSDSGSESEYEDSDCNDNTQQHGEESSEWDTDGTGRQVRRRRRPRVASKVAGGKRKSTATPAVTSGRGSEPPGGSSRGVSPARRVSGDGGSPRRHGGGRSSDSGYETMSEEEIRTADQSTLLRIQRQKEQSRKHLVKYYVHKGRAKKAATAVVEAALREERAAARAARREAIARLRGGTSSGPAWRPGGGVAERRAAAAASDPTTPFRMRFWRPPPKRPPRLIHCAAGSAADADSTGHGLLAALRAAPKPPPIRLGPYNLSPGGPSLLYREPKKRLLSSSEVAWQPPSLRAATWLKGADVLGAVFTQFGWVQPRPSGSVPLTTEPLSGLHPLTLTLEKLPDADLLPVLEAYVRQLGIPRNDGHGSSRTTHTTIGHRPSAHARLQPLMMPPVGDGVHDGSPGDTSRVPPAPNSVAAILGAASTGLSVSHVPLLPHPPVGHHPAVPWTRPPISTATRGSVVGRIVVTTAAHADADVDDATTMVADTDAAGVCLGQRPSNSRNNLAVHAVFGRSLASPVGACSASTAAASPSAASFSHPFLLPRARSHSDGQERGGNVGGGGGSFSNRLFMTSERSLSPPAISPGQDQPPVIRRSVVSPVSISPRARGSPQVATTTAAGANLDILYTSSSVAGAAAAAAASATALTAAEQPPTSAIRSPGNDCGVLSGVEDVRRNGQLQPLVPLPLQQLQEEQPQLQSLLQPQEQVDGGVPAIRGQPFQVAVAVLRSKSIRPWVTERIFPQGRIHINDPTSSLAPLRVGGDGGGDERQRLLSYPLDDIMSSTSSTSDTAADAQGWSTDSDCEAQGPRAEDEGKEAAAAVKVAAAAVPSIVSTSATASARRLLDSVGGDAAAARGMLRPSPQPHQHQRRGSTGYASGPKGRGTARAAAGLHDSGHEAVAGPAGVGDPATLTPRIGEHPTRRRSWEGGDSSCLGLEAAVMPWAVGRGTAQRVSKTRPVLPPPMLIIPSAAALSPVAETSADFLQDEYGLRQFDLLYDMTRWASTPPPTPVNYRFEDDHIVITLTKSKEARLRAAEEEQQERRARLLTTYGGHGGTAMYGGSAYERVLYRRRHACAMATLAASQSPMVKLLRSVVHNSNIKGKPFVQRQAADDATMATERADASSSGGSGGCLRIINSDVVRDNLDRRLFGFPSARGRIQMRVRPGGGCSSGFGNSYYWRQPIRLASLIHIRPADSAQRSSVVNVGALKSVEGGGAGGSGDVGVTRGSVGSLSAMLPPPPKAAVMADTAMKLLSELGTEIGRMEEEIEALQRKAGRDDITRQPAASDRAISGAGAGRPLVEDSVVSSALSPPLPPASATATGATLVDITAAPSPSPPPQRCQSTSTYSLQHLTFNRCTLAPQQQQKQKRPASRGRQTQQRPTSQRLTFMSLEPPSVVQGTPVPRLQRPTSPTATTATTIAAATATAATTTATTVGAVRAPVSRHVTAIANTTSTRRVPVLSATRGGQAAASAAGRCTTEELIGIKSRTLSEETGDAGGDGGGGGGGGGSVLDIHSLPVMRVTQPAPSSLTLAAGAASGLGPLSPNLYKVSIIPSRSGSRCGFHSAGLLLPVTESTLLDAVISPGHPMASGGGVDSGAGGGPTDRRLSPGPALVPTPHNMLSSGGNGDGGGGWPASQASSGSGMVAVAATEAMLPPPPAPTPAWFSPQRSITGMESTAVAATVPWDISSPRMSATALPPQLGRQAGALAHPLASSPATLLPTIATTSSVESITGSPKRPGSDDQHYGLVTAARPGHHGSLLWSGSAALPAGVVGGSGALLVPPPRQPSAGPDSTSPWSQMPLSAWGPTSVLSSVLPDISSGTSPKTYMPVQQGMRSSVSSTLGGVGLSEGISIALSGRPSTSLASATSRPAAAAAAAGVSSPPHSPIRSYHRMDVGLGAGGSPYRHRRGSANGPTAPYYQYSVGSAGQQSTSYDYTSDLAAPAISVDSLLLNVTLLGGVGLGGGGGSGGSGGMGLGGDRQLRTSVLPLPPSRGGGRRARASDASLPPPILTPPPAPPLAAAAMEASPAAMPTRFSRVRRLSIGPYTDEAGGGGAAAMVSPKSVLAG